MIKIGRETRTKSGLRLLNDYAGIFLDPISIFIIFGAILYLPLKLLGAETLIDFLYKHFKELLFLWFIFYVPSLISYLFLSLSSKFKRFLDYGNKELGIFLSGLILLFLTFLFSIIGFVSEISLLALPFGLMAYAFFKLCCYFPFILIGRMIALKTVKLVFK